GKLGAATWWLREQVRPPSEDDCQEPGPDEQHVVCMCNCRNAFDSLHLSIALPLATDRSLDTGRWSPLLLRGIDDRRPLLSAVLTKEEKMQGKPAVRPNLFAYGQVPGPSARARGGALCRLSCRGGLARGDPAGGLRGREHPPPAAGSPSRVGRSAPSRPNPRRPGFRLPGSRPARPGPHVANQDTRRAHRVRPPLRRLPRARV